MSAARLLVGLLFLGSALTGCLSTPASVKTASLASALPQEWYAKALAHDEGHNHTDLSEHTNASTPNFVVMGHDPLVTTSNDGKRPGFGCGDVATTDTGRRISLVDGFMNDITFVLVDVTDAAHPQKVGEFYSKGMKAWDTAITPDGKYAIIAFTGQPRTPGAVAEPMLSYKTACGAGDIRIPVDAKLADMPDTAVTNGVVVIDISDPAKPTYVDWDPMPGRNMHSTASASIDNQTWIMGSSLGGVTTFGLAPPGIPPPLPVNPQHQMSYVGFDQLVDTPAGKKLVRVSTFQMPVTVPTEGPPVVPFRNGHIDSVMQRHPIDGKVYAYIADWEGGVITVDMSNPRVPVLAGMWMPPHDMTPHPGGDGPCYLTAIHDVLPAPEAWDGKHYYFAGQECPMKTDEHKPGGSVWVIDNTDPKNPKTVGDWHMPEDTGVWTAEYQASPHYIALHNRTLFVTNYHAGLWAADVSSEAKLKSPPSIGVYLPDIAPPGPPQTSGTAPTDEQVDVYPDGEIVLVEDASGAYVLHFDDKDPAPPAVPFVYS